MSTLQIAREDEVEKTVKVTKWEFEGTVEELSRVPGLRTELGLTEDSLTPEPITTPNETPARRSSDALPTEVAKFVRKLSRSETRTHLMLRLLAELLDGGEVEFEIGRSSTSKTGQGRYLMIYKRGPRYVGAVAYLMPSNGQVDVRLGPEHANAFELAAVRGTTGAYRVTVLIGSDEAVDTAKDLVDRAIAVA